MIHTEGRPTIAHRNEDIEDALMDAQVARIIARACACPAGSYDAGNVHTDYCPCGDPGDCGECS